MQATCTEIINETNGHVGLNMHRHFSLQMHVSWLTAIRS